MRNSRSKEDEAFSLRPRPAVSGRSFRHPDVRTYDWQRNDSELRLVVRFEGSEIADEYVMKSPKVSITEEPYSYD